MGEAKRCLRCKNTMTWAEQRQQYGRLLRSGLPPEAASKLSPQCRKCVTLYLGTGQSNHSRARA
jgi:hypothetical protein